MYDVRAISDLPGLTLPQPFVQLLRLATDFVDSANAEANLGSLISTAHAFFAAHAASVSAGSGRCLDYKR